jgi:hypothetical protein
MRVSQDIPAAVAQLLTPSRLSHEHSTHHTSHFTLHLPFRLSRFLTNAPSHTLHATNHITLLCGDVGFSVYYADLARGRTWSRSFLLQNCALRV